MNEKCAKMLKDANMYLTAERNCRMINQSEFAEYYLHKSSALIGTLLAAGLKIIKVDYPHGWYYELAH